MSAITIPKGAINLAGLLFKPGSISGKLPAIVLMHPGGGVKEQAPSIYAKKLSAKGYVAIAYDAAHQGASEGIPRFLEDPGARVTDASAVADYLERLDYVDANRINLVGICAGGGYAVAAATGDHRFKAVAIVSAFNMGDGVRLGRNGKDDPADKVGILEQVAQKLQTEAQTNEPTITTMVRPDLDPDADKEARDVYEYYLTPRAQHPNSPNKMLLRSLTLTMTFDAWAFADVFLTQPLLIVNGEQAKTKWHSEKLFKMLEGKNKGLKRLIHPKAGHVDLYDQEEFVNPTVDEIDALFKSA